MKLDTNSLAHTQWECKYHIVFAPKYRRQIIYGKIKQDIGQMIRKLDLLTEQTYRMVVDYYIYYYNNLRPHTALNYLAPLVA